jgi:ATP-dependent RNA helicase MSS116
MGFRPDIEAIKEYLPPVPQRQTFLFSATVSQSIQQIARSTMAPNHKFINCVTSDSSPVHAHIPQYHTLLPDPSQQIPHILRLIAHDQLTNPGNSKVILFLPTTKMTQMFSSIISDLAKTTFPAGRNTHVYEIHSKRTMESRKSTSAAFRTDTSGASILVTSDVSARGVDYPGVSRVIQVGIPSGTEHYIHRVGRTGRAGTTGRGDLVLLPWEINFASSQLSMVPLKPLSTSELTKQTTELAAAFDKDPSSFFANATIPPPAAPTRRGRPTPTGPALFPAQVSATIDEVDANVRSFITRFDEEAIKETFMSLLGYYISRTSELRQTRENIVQEIKQWAVQACGLDTPPYVSASFLAKLGVSSGGSSRKPSYGRPPQRENAWTGRTSRTANSWPERRSRDSTGERGFERKEPYSSRGNMFADSPYSRGRAGGRDGDNTVRRTGGFGQSGGYAGRSTSAGGYAGRSAGGFAGRSEGGFAGRSEGGFAGRSEGGYAGRSESGSRGGYKSERRGRDTEEQW